MHTIIHPNRPARRTRPSESASLRTFRQPNYDCRDHPDRVKLAVYVPGVEAAGVEIEARGPDLFITARKSHFVRVNWQAAHLESAQRDYQLRLRLGTGFDYAAMEAGIHDGVLTVTLPKRSNAFDESAAPFKRAAA
jgi:HSP20 family protein